MQQSKRRVQGSRMSQKQQHSQDKQKQQQQQHPQDDSKKQSGSTQRILKKDGSYLSTLVSPQLIEYYVHQFCLDFHDQPRSFPVTCFLLFVRFAFGILLFLSVSIVTSLKHAKTPLNLEILLQVLKPESEHVDGFFAELTGHILVSATNLSFVVLCVICMLTYLSNASAGIYRSTLSGLAQTYNYVCFIPFLALSSPLGDNRHFALANFFVTISISLCIRLHDYDFRLVSNEHLSKRSPVPFILVNFLFELLPCIVFWFNSISSSITCFVCFLSSAFPIFENLSAKGFTRSQTRYLSICLDFQRIFLIAAFLLWNSSGIFASLHTATTKESLSSNTFFVSLPFLALLLSPIAYSISRILFKRSSNLEDLHARISDLNLHRSALTIRNRNNYNSDFIIRSSNSSITIDQIEEYLRGLLESVGAGTFEEYRLNEHSILLDDLLTKHQESCLKTDCMFCSNNSTNNKEYSVIPLSENGTNITPPTTAINLIQQKEKSIKSRNYEAEKHEQIRIAILDGKDRLTFVRSFVRNFFRETIRDLLARSERIPICFLYTYFAFCLQIEQSKLMSFLEIIRFKSLSHSNTSNRHDRTRSLREEALLQELIQRSSRDLNDNSTNNNTITQKSSVTTNDIYKNSKSNSRGASKQFNPFPIVRSSNNTDSINYFDGILFDEGLNEIEGIYYETLKDKLGVLNIIGDDYFRLNEFRVAAVALVKSIQNLRVRIDDIAQIHYSNLKIQFYMNGYVKHFAFGQTKHRLFRKPLAYHNNSQTNRTKNQGDCKISKEAQRKDLFASSEKCVVFVSLLEDKFASIQRVQNSFERLFGFSRKQSMKANINLIIPTIIARNHNSILQQFISNKISQEKSRFSSQTVIAAAKATATQFDSASIEQQKQVYLEKQQRTNKSLFVKDQSERISKVLTENNRENSVKKFVKTTTDLMQENHIEGEKQQQQNESQVLISHSRAVDSNEHFKLLLAKNKEGWAVPIEMSMQVECIGQSDCGIIAQLGIIQTNSQFVLLNPLDFRVELVSKNLFTNCLTKSNIETSTISSIYFSRILPMLHYLDKNYTPSLSDPKQSQNRININNNTTTRNRTQQNNNTTHKSTCNYFKTILLLPKPFTPAPTTSAQSQSPQQTLSPTSPLNQIDNFINYGYSNFKNPNNSLSITSNIYLHLRYADMRKELLNSKIHSNIDRFDVYQVKVKYTRFATRTNETSNASNSSSQLFSILEIIELKKLSQFRKIKQGLELLRDQLKCYYGFDMDFSLSYRLLDYNASIHASDDSLNLIHSDDETDEDDAAFHSDNDNNNTPKIPSNPSINQLSSPIEQVYQHDILNSVSPNLIQNEQSASNYYSDILQHQQSQQAHIQSLQQLQQQQQQNLLGQEQLQFIDQIQESTSNINNMLSNANSEQMMMMMNNHQLEEGARNLSQCHQGNSSHSKLFFEPKSMILSALSTTSQRALRISTDIHPPLSPPAAGTIISSNRSQEHFNLPQTAVFSQRSIPNSANHQMKSQKSVRMPSKSETFKQRLLKVLSQRSSILSNSSELKDSLEEFEAGEKSRAAIYASSIMSDTSKSSDIKTNILLLFLQPRTDISLILLKYFGFIAILILSLLTILDYFKVSTELSYAREDISTIPWANTFRANYVCTLNYFPLSELIHFNAFEDPSINVTEQFLNEIRLKAHTAISRIRDLIQDLSHAKNLQRRLYYSYANTNIQGYLVNVDDAVTPAETRLENVPTQKKQLLMTTQYMFHSLLFYDYAFVESSTYEDQSWYYEKQFIDNFIAISLNITRIQNMTQEESVAILTNTEDLQNSLMILVLIVAFVLIASILPLYCFVQIKNQQILRLFATIPPTALESMHTQIKLALQTPFETTSMDIRQAYHELCMSNSNQIKKKKLISTTNQLPRFRMILFGVCVFAFTVVIIHPITNFILIRSFKNEALSNIELLGSLYNLRATVMSNMAVNFMYLKIQLLGKYKKVYNPPYYTFRQKGLMVSNANNYNDMSKIIVNSYGIPKKQQEIYDHFFYTIMNGDICAALAQYPQYVRAENVIDRTICETTSNSVLKRGFLIAIKQFYQVSTDLFAISLIPNGDDGSGAILRKNALIQWQKNLKIIDFHHFSESLNKVLVVIKDFLLDTMETDLNSIALVQTVLLVYQMILLTILFAIGWAKFLKYIVEEMASIRSILQIISIEFIADNPYIMCYLKK